MLELASERAVTTVYPFGVDIGTVAARLRENADKLDSGSGGIVVSRVTEATVMRADDFNHKALVIRFLERRDREQA